MLVTIEFQQNIYLQNSLNILSMYLVSCLRTYRLKQSYDLVLTKTLGWCCCNPHISRLSMFSK